MHTTNRTPPGACQAAIAENPTPTTRNAEIAPDGALVSPAGALTRRDMLIGAGKAGIAAPVAVAAMSLPTAAPEAAVTATEAATVPAISDWRPKGLKGVYIDVTHSDRFNPIAFHFTDGTCRTATDDELRGHFDEEPGHMDLLDSSRIRELFPDGDGELYALFSERLELRRAHQVAGEEHHAEINSLLAVNLDAICDTFAVTRFGASRQLRMLMEAIEHGMEKLTTEQQVRLISSASYVLETEFREMRDTGTLTRFVTATVVKDPPNWPEIEAARQALKGGAS